MVDSSGWKSSIRLRPQELRMTFLLFIVTVKILSGVAKVNYFNYKMNSSLGYIATTLISFNFLNETFLDFDDSYFDIL